MRWSVLVLGVCGLALAACSDEGDGESCIAGSQETCGCDVGAGSRTCGDDGVYGVCQCGGDGGDGDGDSSGDGDGDGDSSGDGDGDGDSSGDGDGDGDSSGDGDGDGDMVDNPPTPPAGADPGNAPWIVVPADQVAETCGLDPALLEQANATLGKSYGVVRHGKLCHEYYHPGEDQQDDSTHAFSASKTLAATVFGIAVYETSGIAESGPRTGPLSDLDRMDYWIDRDSITFNQDSHVAHVLAMTGYNADLSYPNKEFTYDADGSREIQRLADVIEVAIAQDAPRLGPDLEQFAIDFLIDRIGMQNSTWGGFGQPPMAYGWNATVRDMLRLGVLLIHGGTWDGERLLDDEWVHKMTHAAFEDASTGYGYLTWLGTSCGPQPRWPSYPHGLSESPDCGSQFGCGAQQYDVGVWQAVGLGGQIIQGHKGLDLVLVARDMDPEGAGDLWAAVRPALVALDPMYAGDENGFCSAYQSGSYAPDL